MWIDPAKSMIYINCKIPIRAQCSVQDRASQVLFSNPIIMKIIKPILPTLLKKEDSSGEAKYFKAINKIVLDKEHKLTVIKTSSLSNTSIIISYSLIMIIHLMEFLTYKDHQNNYYQQPMILISKLIGSSYKFQVKYSIQRETLRKITFININ